MQRQIFVDTETTGLEVSEGHRVIELACVLAEDRKLTESHKRWFFNPQRQVEKAALEVHGIGDEFLQEQGLFADAAAEFIEFIADAELIMHNAPFDVGFIDMELAKAGYKELRSYCAKISDSLTLARQLHPGRGNSLQALCERYGVDDGARVKHGALLDAELLAEVYFAMTSGQSSMALDATVASRSEKAGGAPGADATAEVAAGLASKLALVQVTADELEAHQKFMRRIQEASES